MESFPVEVIGNILSHLASAKDVMVASATCRKWREATRKHLHTLSFNLADWPLYREFSPNRLEIIITQTIFQTTALQNLCICMGNTYSFSAASVIAWLMYTKDTLRSLLYMVHTNPNVNIFEKCGRQKLEVLVSGYTTITSVDPTYQRFPSLKSLTLHCINISAWDLSLLLSACPKLESFSLVNPDITMSDAVMELVTHSLKKLYVEEVSLEKFAIEADNLDILHLKDSNIELFELISKGNLKQLKMDDVSIIHFDIGEITDHLEVVDVSDFTIMWPKFYQMISRACKLKRLCLWGIVFDTEDEIMDLETIAVCFPKLSHLSLSYDLKDGFLQYVLRGSAMLENVITLKLGSTLINDSFVQWIGCLLERCPRLEKLIIHGFISETKTRDECTVLARFSSSIVKLARKFINVDIHFDYQ